MNGLISVIVPVYNVEKYLNRCVKSIINQSFKNIEIILVDDGSPDNCPKMCDEFAKEDSRIKVIHKKNAGLGMARNSGLDIAIGEYIAFVDSDDYLPINALEKMYDAAKENQADTVLGGYYREGKDGFKECYLPFSDVSYEGKEDIIDNVLVNMLGSPREYYDDVMLKRSAWASLYSRKVIVDNKLAFHSEREFISEDVIFDLDYYPNANKVVLIKDLVYYYCSNGSSLTLSYNPERYKKYVILANEVEKRAKALNLSINDRLYRSFIGNVRTCIYSNSKYLKMNEAIKKNKEICNDDNLKIALSRYKPLGMPLKQKIFTGLMRKRMAIVICLVCRLFK